MCKKNCDVIELTVKQFLSGFPVKDIAWEDLHTITWDEQETLIKRTVYFKSNLTYPLRISYQKAFVKSIIDKLEALKIAIHDNIFEAYGDLVSKQELDYCFRHFVIPSGKIFTFQENVNIISEGTTGLSAWQGGIALAEWCLNNRDQLKDKTILELGSGVGLTSLITVLTCKPKKTFLTDCHESVLRNLCKNVELNLKQNEIPTAEGESSEKVFENAYLHKNIHFDNNSASLVEVVNLPWEEVTEDLVVRSCPNFVLAADVVYDSTLFVPLIKAFKCFLKTVNCKIVLACTERNEETLNEFLSLLRNDCSFSELSQPQQNILCWSAKTSIKIFMITNK